MKRPTVHGPRSTAAASPGMNPVSPPRPAIGAANARHLPPGMLKLDGGEGQPDGQFAGEGVPADLFSKPDVLVTETPRQFHGDIAAARTWAMDNLRKEPLPNDDTGMSVHVGYNAIEKATSESALAKSGTQDHIEALPALPQLVKHAVLSESHADRDANPNIRQVHRFYAPLKVDGKTYRVKLTVKEYAQAGQGPGFYSHELSEIEMPAWKQEDAHSGEPTSPTTAGNISVRDLLRRSQTKRRYAVGARHPGE